MIEGYETNNTTEKLLEKGVASEDVMILQQRLKMIDLFPGTITGSFGYETMIAVEKFQKENQLPITGEVDQQTWDILDSQTQFAVPFSILDKPTIRYGDEGEYVKELQKSLKQLMFYDGEVDGKFGSKTLESVKAFQLNNNITADGIVGKNTWSALIYLYSPLAICEGTIYIVQKGDTLWSIAKRFGTSVDEIMRINNLTSTNISIGQQLTIPGDILPPPENIMYIVQRGDTLWSIAKRFGTSVDEIMRINNLTSSNLSIGQQLIIPKSTTDTFNYIVQRGDSLWAISRRFNTTVSEIKRINGLTSDALSIGQILRIPR